MKKIVYLYVLNTLADWEIGYILEAMCLQSMIKNPSYELKTVGKTIEPIKTLGGITIVPDCALEDIEDSRIVALLLPGANTWNDEAQKDILKLACKYIEDGILVGAICGATLALAQLGALNGRCHTSNSLEYLCNFSDKYDGRAFYKEERAVRDGNLITASAAGGFECAKHMLEGLQMYSPEVIDAWNQYHLTREEQYFAQVLQLLQ